MGVLSRIIFLKVSQAYSGEGMIMLNNVSAICQASKGLLGKIKEFLRK